MSTRFAKQLIYATFYIVVLVLAVGVVYSLVGRRPPSCFDGKQDQGEQGIDCGGPCAAVCTTGATVQPVSVIALNEFTPTAGYATFLAKVENTNTDLASPYFAFSFDLLGPSGTVIQSFPGASFLYPNEVKYVALVNMPLASSSMPTPVPMASGTVVMATGTALSVVIPTLVVPTSTTQWVASSSFGAPPDFSKPNFSTAIGSTTVVVAGQFTSNDTAGFNDVFIIAVLKDVNGDPVGVSQTEIDSVAPNQAEDFSISYPVVPGIDPTETEVQIYAAR
jgi:hypothetical protein